MRTIPTVGDIVEVKAQGNRAALVAEVVGGSYSLVGLDLTHTAWYDPSEVRLIFHATDRTMDWVNLLDEHEVVELFGVSKENFKKFYEHYEEENYRVARSLTKDFKRLVKWLQQ